MCGWMGRGHGFKLLRFNEDFRACSPRRAHVCGVSVRLICGRGRPSPWRGTPLGRQHVIRVEVPMLSLRRCALVIAFSAIAATSACTGSGQAERGPNGSPPQPSGSPYLPSTGQAERGPNGSPPQPSGSPYLLSTHCGIREARIGDTYYVADHPLDDGHGNPPPGWNNPQQSGSMATPTPGVAVFSDAEGHVVRFHARPGATSFLQMCS
jgi:hypothetical protein